MKRIEGLSQIADLFDFKVILDAQQNEYVVFSSSSLEVLEQVADKTAWEAVENHVHLLDRVRKEEFQPLQEVAQRLGQALLCCLKARFPQRQFRVYVDVQLHDSMIIRFHQVWAGEPPYYDPADFQSETQKVYLYQG